jgi:hypothetical protein
MEIEKLGDLHLSSCKPMGNAGRFGKPVPGAAAKDQPDRLLQVDQVARGNVQRADVLAGPDNASDDAAWIVLVSKRSAVTTIWSRRIIMSA